MNRKEVARTLRDLAHKIEMEGEYEDVWRVREALECVQEEGIEEATPVLYQLVVEKVLTAEA